MTEELIKPLLEEIERKDDRLYMQSNVIAVLMTAVLMLLMISIALQNHYEPQIYGLRAQLSRKHKSSLNVRVRIELDRQNGLRS